MWSRTGNSACHRAIRDFAATALASAGLVLTISAPAFAQPTAGGIDFPSVAVARTSLLAKPGIKQSNNDGWLIIEDTDGAIWSFTPSNHFANPAVGRRSLLQRQGEFFVQTQILCQAQKPQCDRLKADYELLDKRMTEAIRSGK